MIIINGTDMYQNFNKNNKTNPINPKMYDANIITTKNVAMYKIKHPIIANINFIDIKVRIFLI